MKVSPRQFVRATLHVLLQQRDVAGRTDPSQNPSAEFVNFRIVVVEDATDKGHGLRVATAPQRRGGHHPKSQILRLLKRSPHRHAVADLFDLVKTLRRMNVPEVILAGENPQHDVPLLAISRADQLSSDPAPLLIIELRLHLRFEVFPHDIAMPAQSQPLGGMNRRPEFVAVKAAC